MNALLNVGGVTSPHNIRGLRHLYDQVETHVCSLKSLVVDPLPTLTVTCTSRELILSQVIKVVVANRLFASPSSSYTTSGDPDS